jgi:hypothetical protein
MGAGRNSEVKAGRWEHCTNTDGISALPLFWQAYPSFRRMRSRRFWPTGAEFRPDISAVWVYPSAGRGLGYLSQGLGAGEHLVKIYHSFTAPMLNRLSGGFIALRSMLLKDNH